MQKKNLFSKKLNKSVLSVTKRIESFFNFFRENFFIKKKRNFKTIDKRIFVVLSIIFIALISYFLSPALYDKNKIKVQIEKQILDKYNLEVKITEPLSYGLFPKPHFYSKNIIINYKANQIAKSQITRISIITNNLFSFNNIKIKDIIFNKTDFRINFSSFNFFIELLNNINNSQKINFRNSKLFYLDKNNEIIFLTNIKKLNYYIEENFLKKLISKFNLFNIPISLNVEHEINKKRIFTETRSLPLRLNIKTNSSYDDKKLNGLVDLAVINKNIKIEYNLQDGLLKFNTKDDKIFGNINIKPFYISLNLNLFNIDSKKIFKENSILVNILKSETLDNQNLNGNINVSANNLKIVNFFDEIKFNVLLEEGDIIVQNLVTTFKESANINLNDTQLIVDENNKLKFAGFFDLDFVDVKKFFDHYQVNIKDRKYIKKINLSFLFHFDDKYIEIYNLKVDGKTNQNLDKFLENFNSKKGNIFNKIVVRKSIKDFFKIISLD